MGHLYHGLICQTGESQAEIAGDTVTVAAAMISTSPISEKPWPATSTRWTEGNFAGMGQLSGPLDSTGHYRILGLVKMEKLWKNMEHNLVLRFLRFGSLFLLRSSIVCCLHCQWWGLSGSCRQSEAGLLVDARGMGLRQQILSGTRKWLVCRSNFNTFQPQMLVGFLSFYSMAMNNYQLN